MLWHEVAFLPTDTRFERELEHRQEIGFEILSSRVEGCGIVARVRKARNAVIASHGPGEDSKTNLPVALIRKQSNRLHQLPAEEIAGTLPSIGFRERFLVGTQSGTLNPFTSN